MLFRALIIGAITIIVTGTRHRDPSALSDEEYDILLRRITGRYDTPVAERRKEDIRALRKYYRWVKQGKEVSVGPSCNTIYIDGKKLMRRGEVERSIKMAEKESKCSGARKVTGRIKARFIGCSEKNVIASKSSRVNFKVWILYYVTIHPREGAIVCTHTHTHTHHTRITYVKFQSLKHTYPSDGF